MSIEICIINPYGNNRSNEKLKKCASKVINENSSIYINEENLGDDYFSHHLETTNISSLVKFSMRAVAAVIPSIIGKLNL